MKIDEDSNSNHLTGWLCFEVGGRDSLIQKMKPVLGRQKSWAWVVRRCRVSFLKDSSVKIENAEQ